MGKQKDIVKLWPELHKVVFKNNKVRIIKASLLAGKKLPMHWHPNHVGVLIKGSKLKISKANKVPEVVVAEDGTFFEGHKGVHAVENVGKSDVEEYFIEFKQ